MNNITKAIILFSLTFILGCPSEEAPAPSVDAEAVDAASDANILDAQAVDAASDAASDAAPPATDGE